MRVVLRLFQQSDPSVELDRRLMAEGEITVGRDRICDWVIPDPTRTLSRLHCVFLLVDGAVTVRDESTNGVFGHAGERLPRSSSTPLELGQAVVLGAFLIRAEALMQTVDVSVPTSSGTLPALTDKTPAGRLLDAFCTGAQIDSSVLSAEDPTDVMRRLGAMYREMVVGLSKLVAERTRAKAEYGLEWTAVQALDNNPFRWAPPQRVAVDLLQSRQEGFLSSEAAVRASFEDVGDHQVRLAAASQAAIDALLADLAPDTIAGALQGQPPFMKKRPEALWAEYLRAHAKACKETGGRMGGLAFREAYSQGALEPSCAD